MYDVFKLYKLHYAIKMDYFTIIHLYYFHLLLQLLLCK